MKHTTELQQKYIQRTRELNQESRELLAKLQAITPDADDAHIDDATLQAMETIGKRMDAIQATLASHAAILADMLESHISHPEEPKP